MNLNKYNLILGDGKNKYLNKQAGKIFSFVWYLVVCILVYPLFFTILNWKKQDIQCKIPFTKVKFNIITLIFTTTLITLGIILILVALIVPSTMDFKTYALAVNSNQWIVQFIVLLVIGVPLILFFIPIVVYIILWKLDNKKKSELNINDFINKWSFNKDINVNNYKDQAKSNLYRNYLWFKKVFTYNPVSIVNKFNSSNKSKDTILKNNIYKAAFYQFQEIWYMEAVGYTRMKMNSNDYIDVASICINELLNLYKTKK